MPESVKKLFRPGGVLYAVLGIVALGVISWGVVVSVPRNETRMFDPLTNQELAATLARLGLDAEPLTAVGASSTAAQGVVAAARSHLEDEIQSVRDADQQCAQLTAQVDDLRAKVSSGLGSGSDVTALGTAQTQLTTALNSRKALLADAFTAATGGLSAQQVATIQTIQASREAGWDLPTAYMTTTRSPHQWLELRQALANKRITAKLGESIHPEAEALLETENANATVAAANYGLTNNLSTISSAWHTSVYPP